MLLNKFVQASGSVAYAVRCELQKLVYRDLWMPSTDIDANSRLDKLAYVYDDNIYIRTTNDAHKTASTWEADQHHWERCNLFDPVYLKTDADKTFLGINATADNATLFDGFTLDEVKAKINTGMSAEHTHPYLLLDGSVAMKGELKGITGQLHKDGKLGVDLNHSSLGNAASIVFSSPAIDETVGLLFPKTGKTGESVVSADFNSLRALDDTLFFNLNKVFHEAFLPSLTALGLEKVNNYSLSVDTASLSKTEYASAYVAGSAYALAASKMTQITGDGRYLAIASTAADADKLGGIAAANYSQTTHAHTATDIGLGKLSNYPSTSAVNDPSEEKYALAKGLMTAYDRAVSGETAAKTYADGLISELMGENAAENLNTIKELGDALNSNGSAIATINAELAKKATIVNLTDHKDDTANPHGVSKKQLELDNVNNWAATSEINNSSKTIYSTAYATKTAYDLANGKIDKTTADGLYVPLDTDMGNHDLFWANNQSLKGLYWGQLAADGALPDPNQNIFAYVRNHRSSQGQLEIGSDDKIDFYESDNDVLAVSISTNNKTLDAKGGLLENGIALSDKYLAKVGDAMTGNLIIETTSPQILFKDKDGKSAFLHTNSNAFYVLRSAGNNETAYDNGPNGRHPLTLNLDNGDAKISGDVFAADSKCLTLANIDSNKTALVTALIDDFKPRQSARVSVLANKWYEITSGSGRCAAEFVISDGKSGNHGYIRFAAAVMYGRQPQVNIIANSAYNRDNGIFGEVRLRQIGNDITYDKWVVEVSIVTDGNISVELSANDTQDANNWRDLVVQEAMPVTSNDPVRLVCPLTHAIGSTSRLMSSGVDVYDVSNPPPITDDTNTTSSTTYASATSVKTAYVLASKALLKDGSVAMDATLAVGSASNVDPLGVLVSRSGTQSYFGAGTNAAQMVHFAVPDANGDTTSAGIALSANAFDAQYQINGIKRGQFVIGSQDARQSLTARNLATNGIYDLNDLTFEGEYTLSGEWLNTWIKPAATVVTCVCKVIRRLFDAGNAVVQIVFNNNIEYRRFGTGVTGSRTWTEWDQTFTVAHPPTAIHSDAVAIVGSDMSGNIGRTKSSSGHLVGYYDGISSGDRTNPIYSMGTNFTPTDSTLASMYGIGYTYSGAAFLDYRLYQTSGWGLYVAADGDARIFLNGTTGDISTVGDIRSVGEHYVNGKRVYHEGYKQNVTASNVGLGSVNNWTATSSITDGSSNKYATASAAKAASKCATDIATVTGMYIRSADRFNMCGNDKGWMPYSQGTGSSSNSTVGNNTWWFTEAWANAFCGGAVNVSGDIAAASDIRVKTNIKIIDNALSKVCQLRGVTFDRTDDVKNKHQTGVIAQELEQVLPQAVLTARNELLDIDDFKSVNYGATVGLLIEAIKELKAEVDTLKAAQR